jgi:hypothetical protein
MDLKFNIKIILLIVTLSILGFFVYRPALNGDFIWDDRNFVVENTYIRDLNLAAAYFTDSRALATDTLGQENYRPLVVLSYAIDYLLWKLNAFGYHITNLLLHILNSLFVFLLISNILKNKLAAGFGALLFLSHPIQTEAVSWISGRSNVLFLAFFLLAYLFYIKYDSQKKPIHYIVSVSSFICALLAKEMAAILPFLLILYSWVYDKGYSLKKKFVSFSPFFIILAVYISIRTHVIEKLGQCIYMTGDTYSSMLTMVKVVGYYIQLMILPKELYIDYLMFPQSHTIKDIYVIVSGVVVISLIAYALYVRKKYPNICFGILWFFIALLPVANIIPIKIFLAERFLYLPSIGYCIVLSAVCARYYNIYKKKHFVYVLVVIQVIIISAYSYRTILRNKDWAEPTRLYERVLEKYPGNFRARYNLAIRYGEKGYTKKAYEQLLKAKESKPKGIE